MPTFDTPRPISATVDVAVGDITIRAGERATTTVTVVPSDPANAEDRAIAEHARVEYADEQLLVKARKPRAKLLKRDAPSIDVTVELPAGSHLRGTLGMADLRADGRLGDVRIKTGLGQIALEHAGVLQLKTGAGDVSVAHAAGHAEIQTGAGDVHVRELAATALIKNANGDTHVGDAAGDLRITAANGRIAVDAARADLSAKSANGDIRVGEVVRGSVAVETSIGDLDVGIGEGTAAWLDLHAKAGKVRNALEAADGPGEASERVEVRARTSLGNIDVGRAA